MAKAFLRSAKLVTQVEPEPVTTDGHTSYPKAIAKELGTDVDHRTSQDKNNVLEQDHRGIKGRYRSMRGFKAFGSADRFCRAFDEIRNFLRPASTINQSVSLARRRVIHVQRSACRTPGWSCGVGRDGGRAVVGGHSRVPSGEGLAQGAVEHAGADL